MQFELHMLVLPVLPVDLNNNNKKKCKIEFKDHKILNFTVLKLAE